eukprot:11193052-Lingulodinium_polyedra.AAC.1
MYCALTRHEARGATPALLAKRQTHRLQTSASTARATPHKSCGSNAENNANATTASANPGKLHALASAR